jgi:undecaprenyl-diphosphatase
VKDDQEQTGQALGAAIGQVQTPAQAKRVLDRVESTTQGLSEAQAGEAADQVAASPDEAIAQAGDSASTASAAAAAALTIAGAETAGQGPKAAATVAAAQQLFAPGAKSAQPPEVQRASQLLKDEALGRMHRLDALDARLFLAINGLPHPPLVNIVLHSLSLLATGGACFEAGAMLAMLRVVPGSLAALAQLVPATTLTTWLAEYPIKAHFRRRRPFVDVVRALVIGKRPGSWSFPSGHTAASFASARALSAVWPERAGTFYGLAIVVAFSRVYLGVHYPGDVLSGAALGSILGELLRQPGAQLVKFDRDSVRRGGLRNSGLACFER